jgi:glutamyl/glutaminyl-tRNA synthetase
MMDYAVEKTIKNGQVMWPVRVALTGLPTSPGGAVEAAEILGREETLSRMDRSISLL